jgi:CRP-like cAMP-binding protein
MPVAKQTDFNNRLISLLSNRAFNLLAPHFESVTLDKRALLSSANEPIEHAYFIESGIASVVATRGDGRELEVGIYGRDGFSGFAVLLGSWQTPYDHYMQLPGHANRVPVKCLCNAVEQNPKLRQLLLQFVHVFSIQTAQTALANGSSTLEQRLARWLVMCHDRIDGNLLNITHEFLAIMLGARRPGVTEAIHRLEANMLIRAQRGQITIRDRAALIDLAGPSYGPPEQEYERLICPL